VSEEQESDASSDRDRNYTLGEAARTPFFWAMALSGSAFAMIGTALIFHVKRLFEWLAIDLAGATLDTTYLLLGITVAATQLVGGWLADRVPLKWLLSLASAMLAVAPAVWLMGGLNGTIGPEAGYLPLLFAVALGIGQGLIMVIGNPVWTRYYGRTHLGRIRGTLTTVMVASTSVGPFVMGGLFDLTGTHSPAMALFAAIPLPLAAAALLLRVPPAVPQGRRA
jgi:MFS-type transporter involved in bile tolerance (Atg22 family)